MGNGAWARLPSGNSVASGAAFLMTPSPQRLSPGQRLEVDGTGTHLDPYGPIASGYEDNQEIETQPSCSVQLSCK